MDKLEFQDIILGLRRGKYEPSYIIELLENNQLNHLYRNEIHEIALCFEKDEDKIRILNYTFSPLTIIRTLKNKDRIVEAIGKLSDDKQKVKIALEFLTDDKKRLMAIEKIEDKEKALPIKVLLSRKEFKKIFLGEYDKKYHQIGLDEDITFGVEIETLGKNSGKILEAAKLNGQLIHKDKKVECGRIVKRRK